MLITRDERSSTSTGTVPTVEEIALAVEEELSKLKSQDDSNKKRSESYAKQLTFIQAHIYAMLP